MLTMPEDQNFFCRQDKDWLDEFYDTLPEEEQQTLGKSSPSYYWDNVDFSLYCLDCGPYEWSVANHDWVWSESAAGILIGEGFAAPVDESEVPKYIAMLEERYGKKTV